MAIVTDENEEAASATIKSTLQRDSCSCGSTCYLETDG